MTAKPCRICEHLEEAFISKLLAHGLAPRAIEKRIGGTTRKGLTRHLAVCLKTSTDERKSA